VETPADMMEHGLDALERDRSIAASLAETGFAIRPGYWPEVSWRSLAEEARRTRDRGRFRPAGVGRGASLRVRPEIRSDHVCWIERATATRRQRAWLDRMEALRRALNETLYLGLFDFEAHLAVYPPGSFYRTHLDRFKDASQRAVSAILYLNDDWRIGQGGLLRLYLGPPGEGDPDPPHTDVLPEGGTLACFLSGDIHHEVLAATRERWSLVGWFVTRA